MSTQNMGPTQLIGLALPHKTTNKNGQSSIDCGQLWQKFEQEKFFDRIPNKLGNSIYAVYHTYEGDHNQPFSYFIGCPVEMDIEIPQGLDGLTLPKAKYQKTIAKGPMPACIGLAWQKIWESDILRAFTTDIEIYDERSADWNNAEVDLFVSIK